MCLSLTTLTNGRIIYNQSDTYSSVGTEATYICDTGHVLQTGNDTRTCQSSGVWSGEEEKFTCQGKEVIPYSYSPLHLCLFSLFLAVDCGPPPSIDNGFPGNPVSTTFGENVTYRCNSRYEISPGVTMSTVSCLVTGDWNTPPRCTGIYYDATFLCM